MTPSSRTGRRSPGHPSRKAALAALLGLAVAACGGVTARAAEPAAGQSAPAPAVSVQTETLDLAACLDLALQRQPRIAAARASLAAAWDGKRSLDDLHVPGILAPDLPVRRKQAALGVTAAAAGLDQAEHETAYAVTRTYYTVIYARQQEQVARGVVERLTAVRNTARTQLEGGARNVASSDVDRATVYLQLAQAQRQRASLGVRRALASLREAVGAGCDLRIDVPPGQLPVLEVQLGEDEIVARALARRGEIVQSDVLTQETCLEIEAQDSSHHKRMDTFAAGGDVHSRRVQQEFHNDEYRPGAVPPEMPDVLAGNRPDRVEHARSLNARAAAAAEVTRNLIALEAADTYLRWEEATEEAATAREAAETGEKLADSLTRDFTSGLNVRVEDVVNARVLGSQARSRYNEYVYHQILALADLERVTAGAFCAGLVEADPARGKAAAQPAGK